MKKYILALFIFNFTFFTCFAQSNQRMVVKHVDGTIQTTAVSDIDEISFVDVEDINITMNVTSVSGAQIKVFCDKPSTCSKYAVMIFEVDEDITMNLCKQAVERGNAQVFTKSAEASFGGLQMNHAYAIVALAYDKYGIANSISKIEASTVAEQAFTIDVDDITWKDAHVVITPKDPDMRYYIGTMRIEKLNNELDGDINNIVGFDYAWWNYVAAVAGIDVNVVIQNDLVSGTSDFRTSGEDGTVIFNWGSKGIVYCYGVDENGEMTTGFEYKIIETKAPVPSDMTFDVTVNELLPRTVHATIIPSDKEATYYVNAQQKTYVDYYRNLDQLDVMCFELVKDDPTLIGIQQGDFTVDENLFPALRENKAYELIIFGFKDGKTTNVTLVPFNTLKTGKSSQQSFEYFFLNEEKTDCDATCMEKIEDGVYSYQVSGSAEVLSTWKTLTGHDTTTAAEDYSYVYNSYDDYKLQFAITGHKTPDANGTYAEMTVSNPEYSFIKKIVFVGEK